ncbi:MAG: FAD-dependent oxidoreductase [Calditrichaeota bacterium]|nr:FAD-dependent oxidoreductase [Calditrichota bacterium]
MKLHPGHFVAVFGGACAGAEAAFQLSRRGIFTVVFDQKALPYGKIEDGLPKWHIKLRDKEERKIDQKLSHPYIQFVPKTRLGRDIDFNDVVNNWGFSAILLAIGAWRDRPLPVEGIDAYVGKGLYYQNPFVEWFNHKHEPDYSGPRCEIHDGAIIVGGGLASIDVAKILMLETTIEALARKGHEVDLFTLEKEGIPRVLERLGVRWEELGLKGATLYYRRRNIDMPIAPMPPNATPEQREKVYQVRKRILKNAMDKYLFKFQECSRPVDKIVENDRLVGLVFQKTKIEDGKVVPLPGTEFEVRAPLVISSIGSIPEPIPGIPSKGELFEVKDPDTGKVEHYDNVFALGNTVTGKGNIRESELHARRVVLYVMDEFLKWHETDYQRLVESGITEGQPLTPEIEAFVKEKNLLPVEQIESLLKRIKEYQQRVGYDGDYQKWVEAHRPVRLEELLARKKAQTD